ncbi:hypothetical protein CPB84DRAFT_1765306 [Gymnopilus junonius]|uniref:C2 NT-type domain-containing protein n=1 Tax=Gymnopilus junonius TaxID=109634 RepID=A0A9P5NUL0_GYMJU|nr:hypothetical protein CPB84DRAFT_1765306 [Gymnopilus junonius]
MSPQPSGSRTRLEISPEDTLKSPKPVQHLFLNRPLNANGSSVSLNEFPAPPHTPSGLRAHIGHLLPRHTYFRTKITIHQISSVPFVGGEFGVRWKIKGVQTPAGQKQGLFDRVKKRTVSDKGKGREDSGEGHNVIDTLELSIEDEPGQAATERDKIGFVRSASSPPSVSITGTGTSLNRGHTPSSKAPSVSSHSSGNTHSQHLSVDWANNTGTTNSSTTLASTNSSSTTVGLTPSTMPSDLSSTMNTPSLVNVSFTPARGMTPYLKLKDHSVVWSHTLDTVVKIDVERETSQLAPSPLKLVVLQRVNPDDPHGSPQNPRLGAVYLNLSEYVGQGPVERRYLLRESKTNATLKVTIEMEYMNGETHYVPPPLAKGEILTGIAGFLDKDIVRRRPRALDVYGPYHDQEELEIDLLGTSRTIRVPRTARSTRRPQNDATSNPSRRESDTEEDEEGAQEEDPQIPFDVQKLPFAYGTRTTEALIDALFNPVITHEKREESPFTIYEPPSPSSASGSANNSRTNSRKSSKSDSKVGLGLNGVPVVNPRAPGGAKRQGSMVSSLNNEDTSAASVYSSSSSSASIRTTISESSKSRIRENGNNSQVDSQSQSHSSNPVPRGVPEGRIVVGPAADEELQIGGFKAWWKRHTSNRPATPMQRA